LDAATRTAAIVASGQDTSGRGGADMRMESRLVETSPGETEVNVVSEVNVTGIMAQFGRGLIQDVSNQMLQKFTGAMRAELEGPGPAGAAPVAPSPNIATGTSAGDGGAAAPGSGVGGTPNVGAGPPAGSSRGAAMGAGSASGAPPPTAAPPIEVLSFGSRLLARAAGRTMRRPLFWVVLIAIAGLLTLILR
jgi:hypothetical protein